jgi:hypothetical protein
MELLQQILTQILTFLKDPIVIIIGALFLVPKATRTKIIEKYLMGKVEPNQQNSSEISELIHRVCDKLEENSAQSAMIMTTITSLFEINVEQIKDYLRQFKVMAMKTDISCFTAVGIINYVMHQHIERKLKYIEEVLINNNLESRKNEIIRNMKEKFIEITNEEVEFLDNFHCQNGTLGKILLSSVDFDVFVNDEIVPIVFSDNNIQIKLQDLEYLMKGYVNRIKNKINQS